MAGEGEQAPLIKEPLDLVRLALTDRIYVKCKGGRELRGRLHAYDIHLNLILGEVEETLSVSEIDDDTYEEVVRQTKRTIPLLFLRGDIVLLISPPLRS